jgi:hypothetical protein
MNKLKRANQSPVILTILNILEAAELHLIDLHLIVKSNQSELHKFTALRNYTDRESQTAISLTVSS